MSQLANQHDHSKPLQILEQKLRYSLGYKKQGNYKKWSFNNYTRKDFVQQLTSAQKNHLPLVALIGNEKYQLVCADFDDLPNNFITEYNVENIKVNSDNRKRAYLAFRQHLTLRYPLSIALTTPSDKCKLLFAIENQHLKEPAHARGLLYDFLNDTELFNLADKSAGSMTQMYINQSMYSDLLNQLSTVKVNTNYITHSYSIHGVTDKPVLKFITYKGDLSGLLNNFKAIGDWINSPKRTKDKDSREQFLRLLCIPTRKLLNGSAFFSQANVANQLGITRKACNEYFKHFKQQGWLMTTNQYCYKYHQAYTYQAIGHLAEFLIELKKPKKKKASSKIAIPVFIKDGNWNDTCLDVVRKLKGHEPDIMTWFYSLHGWDSKPDRLPRIKDQIINYKKKYKPQLN